MTQKWDDLKHKIEKFASSAADKATEFTKDAADKAEKLTHKSKVKLDIFQLEKSKDKEFIKLGKTIFNSFDDEKFKIISEQEEIKKVLDEIKDLNKAIKEKEVKLNDLASKKSE